MSDCIEPYLVEVGTVTLNEPYQVRKNKEHVAWFRDYVFGPGTYPLYAKIVGEQVALVSSPATAVVFASDNPQEMGSSKAMRIPVFPNDVFDGRMALDFSPAYANAFEISDQNPYGVKAFIGHSIEPAWKHLIDAAQVHYFKAELFEHNEALRVYATDNGFLEAPKLGKGLNMGVRSYEGVIRVDRTFKALSGSSVEHYSIPLHEVSDRFNAKKGSVIDRAKVIAEAIIRDFRISIPKKR